MFVLVVYNPNPYNSCFLQRLLLNILTYYWAQKLWDASGGIEEKKSSKQVRTVSRCTNTGAADFSLSFPCSFCFFSIDYFFKNFFLPFLPPCIFCSFCCCDIVASISRSKFGAHQLSAHSCYLYIHSLRTIWRPVHHPLHATLKLWQPVRSVICLYHTSLLIWIKFHSVWWLCRPETVYYYATLHCILYSVYGADGIIVCETLWIICLNRFFLEGKQPFCKKIVKKSGTIYTVMVVGKLSEPWNSD